MVATVARQQFRPPALATRICMPTPTRVVVTAARAARSRLLEHLSAPGPSALMAETLAMVAALLAPPPRTAIHLCTPEPMPVVVRAVREAVSSWARALRRR